MDDIISILEKMRDRWGFEDFLIKRDHEMRTVTVEFYLYYMEEVAGQSFMLDVLPVVSHIELSGTNDGTDRGFMRLVFSEEVISGE